MARREDEWVWGWDSTPGIVSVWAEIDGRATLWRRIPDMGQLVREEQQAFLRKAITHLLAGDVGGVREAYLSALDRLRRREVMTRDVSSRVRLTKTPAEYFGRQSRRELPYEAMLASARTSWSVGDRVRVYRKRNGGCGLLEESEDGPAGTANTEERDYDIDHYARQLRQTFASRLASAFSPADYETVFADPDQMSLFMPAIGTIRTVLENKSVC